MPAISPASYGQGPTCFDRIKMGFGIGFCVGLASGALFGGFSALRYGEFVVNSKRDPILMNQIHVKLKWLASYCHKVYIMGCIPRSVEDLKVLHLSDNFLVVDKQCDLNINTNTPDKYPVTVADQLNHAFPHLADPTIEFGFRFCHRLDYSTSGVLTIALNKKASKSAYIAFSQRKAQKYYLALVYGHVQSDFLFMSKAIGADSRPDFSHCMCTSDKDYCQRPKMASSKLCVLQRGFYHGMPATKVLMKLLSGRRHQLRVHCQDIGHTIIGDFTYSNREDMYPYRMFLHAYRIVLPCDIELIDVATEDPFSEHVPINEWKPTETVHELNEETFSLL
ncbi:hypothetical protein JTE90_012915 [Oedothorax gibbosus]|uniref:Pseudouridine synthase RsuA/RluA-like domain-containing protein n=1 Tax=Oedothorax gibbosus TaxID=931172 RepID=A0AAV6UZM2_9ARAC|nr:hypothetical protein JTE90_012915 [Oedothorax gibbosus]